MYSIFFYYKGIENETFFQGSYEVTLNNLQMKTLRERDRVQVNTE